MENKTQYWKGIEELNRDPEFVQLSKNEFAEGLPLDEVLNESDLNLSSNRRDFLKFFGFSVSAVALAACNKAPVKNVIPYVVQPEEIIPGVPNYYASTYKNTPVVVKTREGRPIKLEGNTKSGISHGGLDAAGQASVVTLYDSKRLPLPLKKGEKSNWAVVDKEIKAALQSAEASGKGIRIVSGPVNGPVTQSVINDFKATYPSTKQVVYSGISYDGIYSANEMCFGKAVIPTYRFGNADVVVSFGADFLGTWLNTLQYTREYTGKRVPTKENPVMSRHIQLEGNMSVTGTNADYRFPLRPSQEGQALMSLYNHLAKGMGLTQLATPTQFEVAGNGIAESAKVLLKAKGKSLVVSGSNDPYIQSLVNQINLMLDSYGNTIDLDNYYMMRSGDVSFTDFVKEAGSLGAVIFYNCNPVFDTAAGASLKAAIEKLPLSVSTGYYQDETASVCQFVTPDVHFLESWNLTEISRGKYSFTQPTIAPVFETRQAETSFAIWSNNAAIANNEFNYYEYIRNWTKANLYDGVLGFDAWWNQALHDGVFDKAELTAQVPSNNVLASDLVGKINTKVGSNDLILYTKVGMGDGSDGNNPWLHEVPDPVSKVTWDNYLSVSKHDAEEMGIEQGNLVSVSNGNYTLEKVPVLVQPGQARGSFGLALGYGRTMGVKETIGVDAFPFVGMANGTSSYFASDVTVAKADGSYELAQTQTHHSIEGRDIVREATLDEYAKDPKVANHDELGLMRNEENGKLLNLWKEFDYKGHKWGLAIDMNACTGCSACVVACSLENNVPVVGRDEVRRRREMHWMRIDRYYAFRNDTEYTTKEDEYEKLESHEFVKAVHMPMMCQHCENAPCETVCPVLATTHSSDGLNQMTYNRCIGTKYCANNCPYKVRRFNWFRYNDNDNFNYYMNNDLGKMVINPDVTVRTRGVMEKCSMCVQRIQAGKLSAKLEGRKVKDGDINTACAQTCPAGAIVFGDMNDPESRISKEFANERAYQALEEIDVKPSVRYMTKIRNVEVLKSETTAHH